MKPYIFLDRDGTINKEKNYLHRVEDFEFEKGCIDGLKLLQKKGYGLVVVTNQSGIGRGYYTLEDADMVHKYMCQQLEKYGVFIEKVYICPHAPVDNCSCRKPQIGLFEQAISELNVDIQNSYAVGDRMRDIEPAKKLKFNYGLLLTGHGRKENLCALEPERIFTDLLVFAESLPYVKTLLY